MVSCLATALGFPSSAMPGLSGAGIGTLWSLGSEGHHSIVEAMMLQFVAVYRAW